jgi:hypothetical protein
MNGAPQQRCREWIKLGVEIGTLLVIVVGLIVAWEQWHAMLVSNEQTRTALHVTERAYITTGRPTLDQTNKAISFFINNKGHIPSGNIEIIVHEATVNSSVPNVNPDISKSGEYYWQRHHLAPLPPGDDAFGLAVPVRAFDASKYTLDGVYQSILVAGQISYFDGFPDDGSQQWLFCFETVYHLILKQIFVVPCEPEKVIPQMENRDGYPRNETVN